MTEQLTVACRCGEPATRWDGDEQICDKCHEKLNQGEIALPADPLSMAISRGMDADSIAKIVGLVEGREQKIAEKAYTAAMRCCQEEMPVVLRSKQGGKSRYAPLDDINPAIKPVYTRHGFALNFSEADSPIPGWKRTICDVRHDGGYNVVHHLDLPLDGGTGAAMNPIQAAISTGSYGQRVLLCRIFNITIADSDKDGQSLKDALYITPEQLSDLKDLIVQNEMDEAKLLKWLGAESLDTITRTQFDKFQTTYRQRKAVKP